MFRPRCVAAALKPEVEDNGRTSPTGKAFFRTVQWSADGTCLLATSSDNSIDTFVVPADLLSEASEPKTLSPYHTIPSRDSVNAVLGYPFFNLQDPATALVLSSVRDHPIRLSSGLTGHLIASYPVVNSMTEEFICPHSLLFNSQGDRIIAGSESLISIFDVSRPGAEPTISMPTGPKRGKGSGYNGAVNMRGIVSALGVDHSSGVLAAGTFSRSVGLYESQGQGECVGVFSVKGTAADEQIGGSGITQVFWSPCGRYLYIIERKSDGVMVYDIRKTGQLLSWLEGRNGQTNQRLGVGIATTSEEGGHEVWAGGMDGFFRMWEDPHQKEGPISPTFEFKAHDDAVSSTVVHYTGGVLASSAGQRHLGLSSEEKEDEETAPDCSLKIWAL